MPSTQSTPRDRTLRIAGGVHDRQVADGVQVADLAQREHDFRGVVDVGVEVVVELEGPSAWGEPRPTLAQSPGTVTSSASSQRPAAAAHRPSLVRPHRMHRVAERDQRERGVPDRGLAGLQPAYDPAGVSSRMVKRSSPASPAATTGWSSG